jgi:hypothetical protein
LAQAPLFVTETPTRLDFDVPCAVAASFFSDVAMRCASNRSITTTITLGNPGTGCNSTQVQSTTVGGTADIVMSAPPGCDYHTPGLLFVVGFSQNTSPTPVRFDITGTTLDGCAIDMAGIEIQMQALGTGPLAVIFNCVEQQRLYPVIARLRTDVVQIPAGTTIPAPGVTGATTADVFFANETLNIHVDGPFGMSLTVKTLTWNMPTLSCIWQTWADAMNAMGV